MVEIYGFYTNAFKHRIAVMPNLLKHRKYICATLLLLSYTVLPALNWYILYYTRTQNIKRSGFPCQIPLFPRQNYFGEEAETNEMVTGLM